MNTEVEYSTKDVTVSWKPTHGINNLYLYSVDGGEFIEISETEIVLTDLEEGWHIVEVKVIDSISLPDRYIHGAFSEDFTPFGRYVFLEWEFSEEVSRVEFRFV